MFLLNDIGERNKSGGKAPHAKKDILECGAFLPLLLLLLFRLSWKQLTRQPVNGFVASGVNTSNYFYFPSS
jgi:hypothetical protein